MDERLPFPPHVPLSWKKANLEKPSSLASYRAGKPVSCTATYSRNLPLSPGIAMGSTNSVQSLARMVSFSVRSLVASSSKYTTILDLSFGMYAFTPLGINFSGASCMARIFVLALLLLALPLPLCPLPPCAASSSSRRCLASLALSSLASASISLARIAERKASNANFFTLLVTSMAIISLICAAGERGGPAGAAPGAPAMVL